MKILLFYDTVFGNTKKIAEAIADGFRERKATVRMIHATEVTIPEIVAADLVVAGSPTRAFRATAPLMAAIANPAFDFTDKKFAAFDTRIDPLEIKSPFFRKIVVWGGYAADKIAKALSKRGALQLVAPQPFFVTGDQGMILKKQEESAAFDWAKTLTDYLAAK